ncbi:MAG: cell division protein DedD [Symbiopectobacterium sp.]
MASKFQNRLVGTIILVALGVIVLPALLDGKKKHYEDEFAAIPLVPKSGDSTEAELLLSLNQSLPGQPPEWEQRAMQGQLAHGSVTELEDDGAMQAPPPVAPIKIAPAARSVDVKPEAAYAGQAYVVQLGALKNADKINEIVAKLRLSGYRAYTVPSTPVAGEITRVYVGPDVSKQKLQSTLGELQQLSGLSGQIRNYSTR